MRKIIEVIENDFPRTPSLLFMTWILFLVLGDLLAALGVIEAQPAKDESDKQNAVVHFVKFQTFEFKNYNIMVGTQYRTNDGSAPEKQWCYIDAPAQEGSHRINIALANKISVFPVTYRHISQASANKIGLSVRAIEKHAKSNCNFL